MPENQEIQEQQVTHIDSPPAEGSVDDKPFAAMRAKLAEIDARSHEESPDPVDAPDDVPQLTPDQQSDVQALLALGCTPDEARSAAESGMSKRILKIAESRAAKAEESKADVREDSSATGGADVNPDDRIAALEAQVKSLSEKLGRQPDSTDDIILMQKHTALFGESRWVQPDSEFAENRKRVREAADVLRAGLKSQGKPVPPDEELVKRAIRLEYGDEIAASKNPRIEQRKTQMIARPTARPSRDDSPGEAKARQVFTEKFRNLGRG